MPTVEIEGLIKRFGEEVAVAGIDLNIEQGEFVTLLGPSGCGKTTTLRCIAGLEHPDRGEIHIEGEPLPLLPGDRFVARGFARNDQHGGTVGGGIVLDIAPPHRRRSDPELLRDLEALAERDPLTDIRIRVVRAGIATLFFFLTHCSSRFPP